MNKKSNHIFSNFLKRISVFAIITHFIFFGSCTFTAKDNSISLKAIKEYIGTDNVQLLYSRDDKVILIAKLAEAGLSPTEDTFNQLKEWSSVIALTLSKELVIKKPDIKFITIQMDQTKFDFNIKDLNAVGNYLQVVEQYFKLIKYNAVDTNNLYLSEKISVESQKVLIDHLKQLGELDNFNLLKFEVVNGKLQVFINMIFKSGKSMPLAFIFLLENDNRIDGIQPIA